ncbi:MAG: acyl-CoA thioesterase [Thermocladium sp.]
MVAIKDTRIHSLRVVNQFDANYLGNLFGGRMMEWMVETATIATSKLSNGPSVISYLDELFFLRPVKVGDTVAIDAWVDYVGRSSMETRVRSEKRGKSSGVVVTSTMSFVAINDYGKPRDVPTKITPAPDEENEFNAAMERRRQRELLVGNRRTAEHDVEDPTRDLRFRVESRQWVRPDDTLLGNILSGGRLLAWLDGIGALVAAEYAGGTVVTGSIGDVAFYSPAYIGDVVNIRAGVTFVGKSTVEIMLNVIAEDKYGGSRHMCTAYYTFVHIGESGEPEPVPPYEPKTEGERRQYLAGMERRKKMEEDLRQIKANMN